MNTKSKVASKALGMVLAGFISVSVVSAPASMINAGGGDGGSATLADTTWRKR